MSKIIKIANGQGFWGDSIDAPVNLVKEGGIDYLTLDYLAEVTLSIMQRQKLKRPDAGYARDFVDLVRRILSEIIEKDIKIITNAGGVNPQACQKAINEVACELGYDLKIGIIEGDNIFNEMDTFRNNHNVDFKNMDTGASFDEIKDKMYSSNVYRSIEQRCSNCAGRSCLRSWTCLRSSYL